MKTSSTVSVDVKISNHSKSIAYWAPFNAQLSISLKRHLQNFEILTNEKKIMCSGFQVSKSFSQIVECFITEMIFDYNSVLPLDWLRIWLADVVKFICNGARSNYAVQSNIENVH